MTDCSSKTPTFQMTMLEDNVFKAAQLSCSFGTFSVTDSEIGPFATHPNGHGLLYKDNQCIL